MNFQQYKNDIEEKLKNKVAFKLLEFRYLPFAFGSGVLAYRIKGIIYRFIYDGKDEILTFERSNNHEKYPDCKWTTLLHSKGLFLNQEITDILLRT